MLEAAGGPTFSELMGNGKPVHASVELLRWFFNYKNKHTLPAIGLGLLEAVPRLFPQQSQKFIAMGKKLREEVQEILGSDGILIMPTYTSPAPKHHLALIPPTNWVWLQQLIPSVPG
jgi:fatty acid amide hydrolase 2